jgi:dihydroxyacetone kinase DhaKLM complex PTS-EIIA-like component DhaM
MPDNPSIISPIFTGLTDEGVIRGMRSHAKKALVEGAYTRALYLDEGADRLEAAVEEIKKLRARDE